MADTNNNPAADSQGSGTTPPEGDTGQTPKKDTQNAQTLDISTNVYTKENVDALLAKARTDEKTKVYGQLDALKSQKEASEKKATELETKLKSLEADLDSVRQGKKTEMESVTQELATLRDQNKKLEKAIDEVADSATQKIRQAKLDGYREKIIAEKGVVFTDSIKGNSEEEILESANEALKKQKQIEETARKKALEEAQKELSKKLPQPLAVDGQLGKGPNPVAGPANREALARLPKDEYQKMRAELLKEAKQKVGLQE